MGYDADEVISVCSNFGYEAYLLTSQECERVVSAVKNKFCYPYKNCDPIWECITVDNEGVHDSQAWSWLSEFVGNNSVLIFFDRFDRSVVFLKNGLNLSAILGECTGFVFYVTDLNFSYLICSNDHDILIGAGGAIDWVKSKRAEQKKFSL